jgi:hypothetical protein
MHTWPETYGKDVIGTVLELRGQVVMEHEIVERRHRADMLFLPERARGKENLGIFDSIADLGPCIIELFSHTPQAQAGFDCVNKHLAWYRELRNQARRNRQPAPQRPRLWIISPGRPRSLLAELAMRPMDDWPAGFWHMAGTIHVHLVVVRDLPVVRDTLLLRLLDRGKRLQRAFAELDELPPRSQLRRGLMQVMVAWRPKILETSSEDNMLSPETKALYAAWEEKIIAKGIEKGRKEGIKAGKAQGIKAGKAQGIKEGERALVRKQLTLRFGKLSADAERRIARASLAELERWAERVLTARSLAAVFAD